MQNLLEKNLNWSQVKLSPKGLQHHSQSLAHNNSKMAAESWAASQVGSSTTPEQDTRKVQYLQQLEDSQEQQTPKIVKTETEVESVIGHQPNQILKLKLKWDTKRLKWDTYQVKLKWDTK